MKLKKITDFVLEQNNTIPKDLKLINNYKNIINYANFLKQPLKLEMFVPCDKYGNVLFKPKWDELQPSEYYHDYLYELDQYQQAKEKVLFEGFEKAKIGSFDFKRGYSLFKISYYEDIEDFLNNVRDIILTQNAIKKLGL